MGTTFQIYLIQVSTSESYLILSHIPGDSACGKATGLMSCDCLCLCIRRLHLAEAPAESMGKVISMVQRTFTESHAASVALSSRGRRPQSFPTV